MLLQLLLLKVAQQPGAEVVAEGVVVVAATLLALPENPPWRPTDGVGTRRTAVPASLLLQLSLLKVAQQPREEVLAEGVVVAATTLLTLQGNPPDRPWPCFCSAPNTTLGGRHSNA